VSPAAGCGARDEATADEVSERDSASKGTIEAVRPSGRSPTFAACVRALSEIPTLVIDAHRCHIIRRKRNFLVPPDLYNAALTREDLIERSTVPEFHGNYLIAYACLTSSFQVINKRTGNWN